MCSVSAACRLPGRLHGGQQQADQDKTSALLRHERPPMMTVRSRESVSTPQGAGIKPTGHTFAPTRRVGQSTFPLATDPVSTARKTRPYPGWESLRTALAPRRASAAAPARSPRAIRSIPRRHAAYPRLSRSYEADPSGTTAGIAAISSKFYEEYQAAQPTWSRIQSPGISVSDERHGNRK